MSTQRYVYFTVRNGAGSIDLTGAVVGESVLDVVNMSDHKDMSEGFEDKISIKGQIQQKSADDLTSKNFGCILFLP